MRYVSTRGGSAPMSFQQAVMTGLADDGGLLVPHSVPDASAQLRKWATLSYPELAAEVFRLFSDDIPADELLRLCRRSYATFDTPDVAPLRPLGQGHFVLELFHGPTLSFKDVALQFLGNLFERVLSETGQTLNIFGATSGDTGSAAIHGCKGRGGVGIFIMHPHKRVSRVQELQMTTVADPNVHNIAVRGSFDDTQRILKEVFSDLEFKRRYNLGAVNSVNWARVMAQTVYYFKACAEVTKATGSPKTAFCVPTGNFGDVFAGRMAAMMGAPIASLVVATNENDILHRYFSRGDYSQETVQTTLSPAMDIQVASNFERWAYYNLSCDAVKTKAAFEGFAKTGRLELSSRRDPLIRSGSAGREQTIEAIRSTWEKHGYLIDPHTAVGVSVAQSMDFDCPVVCLATAHPAKFSEAVEAALGSAAAVSHPSIDALHGLPERCDVVGNDIEAVKRLVAANAVRQSSGNLGGY